MCTGLEVALLASAGASVVSGVQQNQIHRAQAKQSEADADTAQEVADLKAEKIREKARRTAASVRASLASSGVNIDSISGNLINKEITRDSEVDAIIGINDGESAANKLRTSASLDKIRGTNSIISGGAQAGATVITHGHKAGWFK